MKRNDVLSSISVFVHVAKLASFTAAAAELECSTGNVSRQIAKLERNIGVKLLERSTRKVTLTEIGRLFFERCSKVLQDAEASVSMVQDMQAEPRGTLRVTAPTLFGTKHLGRLMHAFTATYPNVIVELHLSDQLESLSAGEFDLAIRITNHLDQTVVARRLATIQWVACASPAYLMAHGVPLTPQDLRGHVCLHYASVIKPGRWNFTMGGDEFTVPVRSRVNVNSSEMIADLVLADCGIGLLPTYLVGEHLQHGRLQALLPRYTPATNSALYALYPPNRYVRATMRRFIDLLQLTFAEPPYWDVGTTAA